MNAPRKPQDRQQKQDDQAPQDGAFKEVEISAPTGEVDDQGQPIMEMVPGRRGVVQGIEVEIEDAAFNDFELLDDIRAAQDEDDASRMPAVLRRLVGDAQFKQIMDRFRDARGRVPADSTSAFVFDLLRAINPNS